MTLETKRRIVMFVGHMLTCVPAILILRAYGWRIWVAFIVWATSLRMTGYVDGLWRDQS